MKKAYVLVLIVFSFTLVFAAGCNEQVAEQETVEVVTEGPVGLGSALASPQAEGEQTEQVATVAVSRTGADDRLPGSLKWGSVQIYREGQDFLADHPDGLKAVSSFSSAGAISGSGSDASSGSAASGSGETASESETTADAGSGSSGSDTTAGSGSGSSGSGDTGSGSGTTTGTGSGSSSPGRSPSDSGNWWELD